MRTLACLAVIGSSMLIGALDRASAQIAFEPGATVDVVSPQSIAIGDFDADGHQDVAIASVLGNAIRIAYGDGAGGFSVPLGHVAPTPYHIATGDFDGDGTLDIVTANMVSSSYSIMLSDGTGHFAEVETVAIGGSPISVVPAHLDADGTLDLAFADNATGDVRIAFGDGLGSFAPPVTVGNMVGASFITTLDVNLDGRLDLIVTSGNSSSFGVFYNNDSADFGIYQVIEIGVDDSLWDVAVQDINGDTFRDLVIPCPNADLIVVYPLSQFGGLGAPFMFPAGDTPLMAKVRDVDGDGLSDVVSANSSSAEVCVNVAMAAGQFADPLGFATGAASVGLGAADLDEDGREDFLVINHIAGTLQILLNRSNGAVVPFIRGDADSDGTIGIGDAIRILGFLFAGEEVLCHDAVDVADNGAIDVGGAIMILSYLFGSAGGLTGLCEQDTTFDLLAPCLEAASSCLP